MSPTGASTAGGEFVLLAIPDMNGSIRGKALRPKAFETALRQGTVMTDLILGLDPVDTPISDYEDFGIRTGAAAKRTLTAGLCPTPKNASAPGCPRLISVRSARFAIHATRGDA